MNRDKLERLYKMYEEYDLMAMDGYHDAIIGIVERHSKHPFVVYDTSKVIQINMEMGMTEEEAWEFFEFNQRGAWVGEATPGFINFNLGEE